MKISLQHQKLDTGALSSRGTYTILVDNYAHQGEYGVSGVYTIYIDCTFRNGSESTSSESIVSQETVEQQEEDFVGFKGVPSKSFAGFSPPQLPLGTPIEGSINATSEEAFGFAFSGTTNDLVQLTFERTSGNLNLGIVVLDENNNTIFQTSAITVTNFSANFVVPSTGKYTVGVFRIDLLPVSSPNRDKFSN